MKIYATIKETEDALSPYRNGKRSIGFVPTMGALHRGHLSLVTRSKSENDVTVCSIFVNPTQFNSPSDLEKYPRTIDDDMQMLASAGCDILFAPSVDEMYRKGDYSTINEDFGILDKVMEGKSRPGHFAGMLTIVNKLFCIIKPDNAYFGKKDFQQLVLIRHFVHTHHLPVIIKACPIVREDDGLAMSSRNRLLSAEERSNASIIPQTLFKIKSMWGEKTSAELKEFVKDRFNMVSPLKLDYFEIVNAETLEPVKDKASGKSAVACIAAFSGDVRLIDNISLTEQV